MALSRQVERERKREKHGKIDIVTVKALDLIQFISFK